MKRFLLKILLFFGIVALLDILYGMACGYMVDHTHSGETARLIDVLKKKQYDVMIMGSSRCVCHYDDNLMSDSLNLRVNNAGRKGNGIILMYGNYHIIPKENKPKVLIYDVEPAFDIIAYENDDHNRRYLDGMKLLYDESGIKRIFKSVDSKEPLKMNSRLYQYNSKALLVLRDFIQHGKVNYSCYLPSHKEYSASSKEKVEKQPILDDLKLHYFERLIMETKDDGVQLVVVASPKYGASSTTELQPIVDLCKKYDVPFWDYYLDMHDTHLFCDNMHLNYEGSQEFTRTVILRLIKEIVIL